MSPGKMICFRAMTWCAIALRRSLLSVPLTRQRIVGTKLAALFRELRQQAAALREALGTRIPMMSICDLSVPYGDLRHLLDTLQRH